MPPQFIQRARARFEPKAATELPPPPPDMRSAVEQWEQLQGYARKVAEVATTTAEANRDLIAENAALQRRIEDLTAQNEKLTRDNRVAHAYGQNLRGRLGAISEAIDMIESESFQYATATVRERPAATAEDDSGAEQMHEAIVRINPDQARTAMVPPNQFPQRK